MHSYKNLLVWQKSVDMVTDVYKITASYPRVEKYGLITQIHRSAVSISSNIAEGGAGRGLMQNPIFFECCIWIDI